MSEWLLQGEGKQEKGEVANLAVHFPASSGLREYFRLLSMGKMHFTQSPRGVQLWGRGGGTAWARGYGETCSDFLFTHNQTSARQQLPVGAALTAERAMRGRTDCSAPALFLDTRKVQHDLNYMKWAVLTSFSNYWNGTLKSLEYSSLFRFGELRNSSHRDAPSTSWVCMGLSCVPNPFYSWNTLQNSSEILGFFFQKQSHQCLLRTGLQPNKYCLSIQWASHTFEIWCSQKW